MFIMQKSQYIWIMRRNTKLKKKQVYTDGFIQYSYIQTINIGGGFYLLFERTEEEHCYV